LIKNGDSKIEQYGFGVLPELDNTIINESLGGELINPNGKAIFASRESLKGLQLIIDQYRKDKSSAQPSDGHNLRQ